MSSKSSSLMERRELPIKAIRSVIMYIPTLTTIAGSLFFFYILYSIWSMGQLFWPTKCSSVPCYTSFLADLPSLQFVLFLSVPRSPSNAEVDQIGVVKGFSYDQKLERNFEIEVPRAARKNGTFFMHILLASVNTSPQWLELKRDPYLVQNTISMIDYVVPRGENFNLLEQSTTANTKARKKRNLDLPTAHIKSQVHVSLMTQNMSFSRFDVPPEVANYVRITKQNQFLPLMLEDFFLTRLKNLVEVTSNTETFNLTFCYNPIGIGKMRLLLQIQHATRTLSQMGFTAKDIDEVKGIFSDTNIYLLCGTLFIGGIHLLFDFLSFKTDVVFWKKCNSFAGISVRTTLWRAFSQIVIFLYLLDEQTSLLVLIPAGIGTLIELWKCKKILRVDLNIFRSGAIFGKAEKSEEETKNFDQEAMRYLSYLLYPLCIAGAVYSLLYDSHKSWYSWTINSLVNGIYGFGFLFMLPQLFVNYKLKSVAALPWKAFMYKAFNTFIDDIFAFIITMPTAHRIACFRDDLVFLMYMYQRWLYPVDKSRLDAGTGVYDVEDDSKEIVNGKPASVEDKKDK